MVGVTVALWARAGLPSQIIAKRMLKLMGAPYGTVELKELFDVRNLASKYFWVYCGVTLEGISGGVSFRPIRESLRK